MESNINHIKKLAIEILEEYEKKQKNEQKDKRLYNTRLLMKNYNRLKEHIDEVNENEKINLIIDEEELDDKVWIMSIVRTKLRTAKMISYLDSALEIIKKNMKKNKEVYKFKAFELYYIGEKNTEEIMGLLNCGKNSVKKWSDLVLNELSLLLWGVEALGI